MKWVLLTCFLLWARHGEGGALKCVPDAENGSCSDIKESGPDIQPNGVEVECQAGTEWESNCHACRCTAAGAAECVRHSCDLPNIVEPNRCKTNTTFQRGCNTCVCLESGLGLCTLRNCQRIPAPVPSKENLPMGSDCAPGTAWTSQCNDCVCSPQGLRYCTEKACIGEDLEPPLRCEPHSLWKKECNTCWCTSDGRAMCTKMGCTGIPSDMHFSEEEGSSTPTVAVAEPGVDHIERHTVCKPRAMFFVGCNPCNCNGDGTDFSCSNKACPLPEDVEVFHELNGVKTVPTPKPVIKKVCVENKMFIMNCNTCWCNEDGTSYFCTRKVCVPDLTEEFPVQDKKLEVIKTESTSKPVIKKICVENKMFIMNCNTCWCNEDGTSYFCTRKVCVPELPEEAPIEDTHKNPEALKTVSTPNPEKKKVCVENKMFIMNCNTCWCNEDGTSFFCTRKVCVPELPEESAVEDGTPEKLRVIQKECRPYEVFELDCNMCRCNADGKSFSCTRRACVDEDNKNKPRSRNVRAAPQEPPKTCQPGQVFRMDCNKCLCDDEGKNFSCTRIDCNALNNNNNGGTRRKRDVSQVAAECVPGSVFEQGCNVCRCTEDGGHATCTLKRCAVRENANATASATESSFRCNPGEQFKQSCNDCSCSADGKSVFCTLRICDEDLSP